MTQQSINLYSEALRPKVDWLSLNLFASYVGGVLLILVVLSAVDLWDQGAVATEVASQTAQRDAFASRHPKPRAVNRGASQRPGP